MDSVERLQRHADQSLRVGRSFVSVMPASLKTASTRKAREDSRIARVYRFGGSTRRGVVPRTLAKWWRALSEGVVLPASIRLTALRQ